MSREDLAKLIDAVQNFEPDEKSVYRRLSDACESLLAENARLRAALEFCAQTNIGFQAVPHEVYTCAREALGQGGETK